VIFIGNDWKLTFTCMTLSTGNVMKVYKLFLQWINSFQNLFWII